MELEREIGQRVYAVPRVQWLVGVGLVIAATGSAPARVAATEYVILGSPH